MRRIGLLAVLLCTVAATGVLAENHRPVLAFAGLIARDGDVSAAELRVFENRITSVLVPFAEQTGFSVTIPRNRTAILELLLGSPDGTSAQLSQELVADAVIAGELTRIEGMLFVDVRSIIVDTMEIASLYSGEFRDFSAALGSAREIVASLVESSRGVVAGVSSDANVPEMTVRSSLTLREIAGAWNGDRGLGVVEIRDDGSGTAHLNGSGTMLVSVSIEDSRVIVRQDEPNAPKMYMPVFPYTVAVQIVDIARPMRWVFTLNERGDTLVGVKDTTFLQVDRGRVIWADNSYSREAVWTRRE
ncbi:MAG: hypothetical protein EA383_11925 [Spirochaetaceae bacterium]|nr:MAG: hypothetical protein EA383_11925 [Spirochaetaceae bacterium]